MRWRTFRRRLLWLGLALAVLLLAVGGWVAGALATAPRRLRGPGLVVAAAVALALAAPAAADAAGIVFIKKHNVWLAKPDGSAQIRVTRDGSAANPYYSPSQADNGTIVALRGPDGRPNIATFNGGGSQLHRLAPSGRPLGPPRVSLFEPLPALVPRAMAAEVSPDGRTVALSQLLYEASTTTSGRRQLQAKALNVVYKDAASGRYKGKSELVLQQLWSPSWIDNRRVLVFDQFAQAGPQVYVAAIGREPSALYRDPARSDLVPDWNGVSLGGGELTRRGDKLALVRAKTGAVSGEIVLYAASGAAGPPRERCAIAGRDIGLDPSLSWSPDGKSISWFEDSGIWTSPVDLSAPRCGVAPRLIIRGGISPDWGPASIRGR